MPDVDLFQFFRWSLAIIVSVYATIITVISLWGWVVFLSAQDRYTATLRRYVILQAVRLRLRTFWADLLICLLLCWVFLLIWSAHGEIAGIERALLHGR